MSALTTIAASSCGSPVPVSVTRFCVNAAMPWNERLRSFQARKFAGLTTFRARLRGRLCSQITTSDSASG